MQDFPSNYYTVTAVMLRQNSLHRWDGELWTLLGLLPGLTESEFSRVKSLGELFNWSDLAIQLYPLHCPSYYQNLISAKPKVYLICNANESNQPQPLLITVDCDEAAAYMETGELVFSAPLADELCVWLERFVLAHYRPEKPYQRRRESWHNLEQRS